MITLLPRWIFRDSNPAFYDTESVTAIEATGKIHDKMNELIEEYNIHVDKINTIITEFIKSENEDEETFRTALRQEFQDFIDTIDLKTKAQDKDISDGITYIKNNLSAAVKNMIQQMKDSGEFTEDVLNAIEDVKTYFDNSLATAKTDFTNELNEVKTLSTLKSILYPRLGTERETALKSLADKYYAKRNNTVYDFSPTRVIYENGNACYDADDKLKINCALFAQLVWAGISVDTFLDAAGAKTTFDGTLTKAFDWGYEFKFTYRKAYGKTTSTGGLVHLKEVFDGEINESYSANSYYTGNPDREDGHSFYTYANAADMANELWRMGCEVPMSEIQPGDLIFFSTDRLEDNKNDNFEKFAFRNITHVAIAYTTSNKLESIQIIESTDVMDTASKKYPIIYNSRNSSYTSDYLHHISLMQNACMVARHPIAFGYAPNVGERFTSLNV